MYSKKNFSEAQNKTFNQNIKPTEFFEYIQQKNKDKIREYFQNPDYKIWQLKDENGYTILHKSVFNNDIEMTELIITEAKRRLGMGKGDSLSKFINDKTNEGLTAVHYAANKGNIRILKKLIENGADIDASTNIGKNVMHLAAEGNQPSMLIYLITEKQQSSQSADENGSTPLHWACYSGAEEAVDFLLNLNVNIDQQDKEKWTPLHLAANEGREKIVLKLLQKNANRNLENNKGELPIDLAKKKNYRKIAKLLGEEDFNPLCSIQTPTYYIQPKDIYKKFIILMIVIPEVIIYLFILPYLEGYFQTLINIPAFALSLVFYFIFIGKDPGYRKNTEMEKQAKGKYPLILKINENLDNDVRNFCPKCYIQKSVGIKHCFICDKCVVDFSHHCFWFNKCIAKNNRFLYILFILFSLIYVNHTLYISLELFWDDINLPYDSKPLHIYLFQKTKGFRILGAAAVGVFSLIVGLPLWFLFLIEMFKSCKNLGKKRSTERKFQEMMLNSNDKKSLELIAPTMVELQEEKNVNLIEKEEVDEKDLLLVDNEYNNNVGAINDVEPDKGKINVINYLEDEDNKEEGDNDKDEEDNKNEEEEEENEENKEEEDENEKEEEKKEEEKEEEKKEDKKEENKEEEKKEEENEENKEEENNEEEKEEEKEENKEEDAVNKIEDKEEEDVVNKIEDNEEEENEEQKQDDNGENDEENEDDEE